MAEKLNRRGRPRVQTKNFGPSLTVQSDAKQADIKEILKKYREVGIVEHLNITEANYRDVTELTDFSDVMRTANEAKQEFMKLPSKVREIFHHDVAIWLDTAHDQEKRTALREAGEISPIEPPAAEAAGNNSSGNDGEGNSPPPTT